MTESCLRDASVKGCVNTTVTTEAVSRISVRMDAQTLEKIKHEGHQCKKSIDYALGRKHNQTNKGLMNKTGFNRQRDKFFSQTINESLPE